MKPKQPDAQTMQGTVLLKTDGISLTISADPRSGGKLRLTSLAWEDAKVILPGECMVIEYRDGQAVLVRRRLSEVRTAGAVG